MPPPESIHHTLSQQTGELVKQYTAEVLIKEKTEAEHGRFAEKMVAAMYEYPDSAYASTLTDTIRDAIGLTERPYITLHGTDKIAPIVFKEFVTLQTPVIRSTPTIRESNGHYGEDDGFTTLLTQLQQDPTEKVIHIDNTQAIRMSKDHLQILAEFAEKNHHILFVEESILPSSGIEESAVSLTEEYHSIIVNQKSVLPGIGWTIMSQELGIFFNHVKVPYSPRGMELVTTEELLTFVPLPPLVDKNSLTPPLAEPHYSYFPPIRDYFQRKVEKEEAHIETHGTPLTQTTSYVHARNETSIDVSRGEFTHDLKPLVFGPLDSPQAYTTLGKKLWEAARYTPSPEYIQEVKDIWKTYWQTPEDVELALGNGTDKLIQLFIRQWKPEKMTVLGHGPQFPRIVDDALIHAVVINEDPLQYEYVPYEAVEPDSFSVQEGVRLLTEKLRAEQATGTSQKRIVYLTTPSSPIGDTVSLDEIAALAELVNGVLIVDEAFIFTLPKERSALSLMKTHKNIIVLQSTSKGPGLSGLGFGITAIPKGIYEGTYDETFPAFKDVEVPLTVPQFLAAEALPSVLDEYRETIRPIIRAQKAKLINKLEDHGIVVVKPKRKKDDGSEPEQNNEDDFNDTLIFTVIGPPAIETENGEILDFHDYLRKEGNVLAAEGSAFFLTHAHFTNQFVRITVPMSDEDLDKIVEIIVSAYEKMQAEYVTSKNARVEPQRGIIYDVISPRLPTQ